MIHVEVLNADIAPRFESTDAIKLNDKPRSSRKASKAIGNEESFINYTELSDDEKEQLKNEKKEKKKSINQFAVVRDYCSGLSLTRNEVTMEIENYEERLTEQQLNSLYIHMYSTFLDGNQVSQISWRTFLNSDYIIRRHPLKEVLTNLKANSTTGNISALARCLSLNPHQGMSIEQCELFLRKWFIGLVAGVFEDNFNCLMIILIGGKNVGKTWFFRHLLPESLSKFFTQSNLQNGKDDMALMCENLILFVDEADGITSHEAAALRGFMSQNYFSYRAPYAVKPEKRKRIASLCAASNDKALIMDLRNNRRLVPIEITAINHGAYNSIDKIDLLAEAYQLYMSGEDWNLSQLDIEQLESISAGNAVEIFEIEMIPKYFKPNGNIFMTSSEISTALERLTLRKIPSVQIGKAMGALGFEKRPHRIEGKPVYGYFVYQVYQT